MSELLKVTLEFEDKIISLEGEEARKWKSAADGQSVFCHTHGIVFPELPWKVEQKQRERPVLGNGAGAG